MFINRTNLLLALIIVMFCIIIPLLQILLAYMYFKKKPHLVQNFEQLVVLE